MDMKITSRSEQHAEAGMLSNLRLVPLFIIILGGIMLLFAASIGTSSYFLQSSNQSLDDVTQEIDTRMGISNSSNHLRTARLLLIQAAAAARIGDSQVFNDNLKQAEQRLEQSKKHSWSMKSVRLKHRRIWRWTAICVSPMTRTSTKVLC